MIKTLKYITLISLLGAVATLAIGTHLTLKYIKMNRDVTIEFQVTENIKQAEPFELNIKVLNRGTAPLKNAELILKLPKEIANQNASNKNEVENIKQHLGDIIGNSFGTASATLIATETSEKNIVVTAVLRYINESGTKYENEQEIPISAEKNDPLKIKITAPNEIVAGSLLDIDIEYENTSSNNYSDVTLAVEYPDEMKIINSNLPPENGRDLWSVGEVQKSGKGNIHIRGLIEGRITSAFEVKATAKMNLAGKSFIIGSGSAKSQLTKSPINIEIMTHSGETVIESGQNVEYIIKIKNESGVILTNTVARALISGAFEPTTLTTDGKANNASTSVVWDSGNKEELRNWNPNTQTELKVSLKTKDASALLLASEKDKKVKIAIEVTSETVPEYIKANQTRGVSTHEITLVNSLSIDTKTYFNDPKTENKNSGTLSLKAKQPTSFTIHWAVKNYGPEIENILITGTLSDGVVFKAPIKTSIGSGPRYDTASKQVIWQIDKIPARETSGNIEVIFQITATPELKHVGTYMTLMEKTKAIGKEVGTQKEVSAEDIRQTSQLTDDPLVGKNDGKVIP